MLRRALATALLLVLAAMLLAPTGATANTAGTWCGDKTHLAIVGASSETGLGTTGYSSPDDGYAPTRYGWTRKVAHNLNVAWGTSTTNYAHNGAMVKDYFPGGRWDTTSTATQDMAATQPDLVIINLGGNEYVNSVDPAVFDTNLTRLVTDIRTARPGVDILFLVYPTFAWPNTQHTWSEYTTIIGRTAANNQAALMDLRQHVDSSTHDTAGLWYTDGAHLNDAGQSAVAAALWGWLVGVC